MPLLQRTGGMGAKGFGLTSVNTFSFIATISSNTTSYNLATQATAAGWNGVAPLIANVTINNGVVVSGTGNGTSSAFVISGLSLKSIITINNSGTITGSGGAAGSNGSGAGTSPYPGNPTSVTPITYANGYNGTGYPTGYGAGGSTPGYNYYSGGGAPGGTAGSTGTNAIYLASNVTLIINNSSTGLIVGGGGGGGGQAGNNAGGGAGGAGGYLIQETGSHPAVIVNNTSGGIVASGGGGSGGWGNRAENDGIGGRPGYAATNDPGGQGNYGGNGISPGLATNNTGNTLVNTTGTFTLSPAA
jgi:hypothetical protein